VGYEIRVTDIKFNISKEHFSSVLSAIARIPEILAWTDRPRLINIATKNHLSNTFDELMWPIEINTNGDISDLRYEAPDKKLGDEAIWMEAIAPYVTSGSYIEVHGEDGDMWRWYFLGGKFYEVKPTITWNVARSD